MVLLPTRSRTASICLASAMWAARSGRSNSTREAPNFSSMGKRSGLRAVAMTRAPAATAILSAAWPNDDVAPRITRVCPGAQVEVAEQACPRGRIGLRQRCQLRPGQIGFDESDVRRAHAGVFGVAAVDGSAEAAHQRRHLRADRELPARAGVDDADAFDAADFRGFGPFAATHVHLGVVDTETLAPRSPPRRPWAAAWGYRCRPVCRVRRTRSG